jgi:hypothetical protein
MEIKFTSLLQKRLGDFLEIIFTDLENRLCPGLVGKYQWWEFPVVITINC